MDYLSICDFSKDIEVLGCYKIVQRCNKGYEPYYTLHKHKTFLCFSWWGSTIVMGEYYTVFDRMVKLHTFPDYIKPPMRKPYNHMR